MVFQCAFGCFFGRQIVGYDQYQTLVYASAGATSGYVKLDNDGCLRWYRSEGDFAMTQCS